MNYFVETKNVMGVPGNEPPVISKKSSGVSETALEYSSNEKCTITFKECVFWPEVSYEVRKGTRVCMGWPNQEFGENGIYAEDNPGEPFELAANDAALTQSDKLSGWNINGSALPIGTYITVLNDIEADPEITDLDD